MKLLPLAILLLVVHAEAQDSFKERFDFVSSQEQDGLSSEELRPAFAAALRAFLQLSTDDPQYARLLPQAGRAALGAGKASLACEFLEEARLLGEGDAYLVAWWLRAHLAAGAVESSLRRAWEWDKEYTETVGQFVAGADGTGQIPLLEGAGRALRRGGSDLGLWLFARVAVSQHPIALANLALAERHLDRLDVSEETYRRALKLAPNDGILWNDFGLFLKGSGRLSEAWEAFQKSYGLETNKGMGPATTNLLLLSRNSPGKWPEASMALAALLRLRPDTAFARRLAIERILAAN